jgi:cleavage and polyadenylation specificity factor subunit 1
MQKCNPYDRELLAIYEALRYFHHMLEARHFTILPDHKPLTFAFHQKRDKCSPRQLNHYISIHIRHKSGQDNVAAYALSRVVVITAPVTHDMLAPAQDDDEVLRTLLVSNNTTA